MSTPDRDATDAPDDTFAGGWAAAMQHAATISAATAPDNPSEGAGIMRGRITSALRAAADTPAGTPGDGGPDRASSDLVGWVAAAEDTHALLCDTQAHGSDWDTCTCHAVARGQDSGRLAAATAVALLPADLFTSPAAHQQAIAAARGHADTPSDLPVKP